MTRAEKILAMVGREIADSMTHTDHPARHWDRTCPACVAETPERDALDHIMRVAREGITPTRRLDWIALRAQYALEGKMWSRDIKEHPRNSVAEMAKENAELRSRVAELEAGLGDILDADENKVWLYQRAYKRARALLRKP